MLVKQLEEAKRAASSEEPTKPIGEMIGEKLKIMSGILDKHPSKTKFELLQAVGLREPELEDEFSTCEDCGCIDDGTLNNWEMGGIVMGLRCQECGTSAFWRDLHWGS